MDRRLEAYADASHERAQVARQRGAFCAVPKWQADGQQSATGTATAPHSITQILILTASRASAKQDVRTDGDPDASSSSPMVLWVWSNSIKPAWSCDLAAAILPPLFTHVLDPHVAMPDCFVPYPSPAPSGGSPAQTQVVDPTRPNAGWTFDPFFDTMYDQSELTDEEIALLLDSIVDIPPTEPLFDVPAQDPGKSSQMNSLSTSTNPHVVPPSGFRSNEPALQSAHSQPRPHPSSRPALTPNSTFTPPLSPYTVQPDQLYQPRAYQQQAPVFQPPARQMNPAYRREPERMALPTPGDLDVSMCEIVM